MCLSGMRRCRCGTGRHSLLPLQLCRDITMPSRMLLKNFHTALKSIEMKSLVQTVQVEGISTLPSKIWPSKKYELFWQHPLWESRGMQKTLSRLQICEYWKGLFISLIYSVLRNLVSQKEQFLALEVSPFGQLWAAFNRLCAEISIESKWVCRHIKLSYDLEQNATNAKTQFDMAVNPLWFNINLKTRLMPDASIYVSPLPECTFLWVLFSMNFFYKIMI